MLTTNSMGLKSNSSIFMVCTTSDKQISRTFQEFFKDKLQFSRTTIFQLNRRHSLTPFDHPIAKTRQGVIYDCDFFGHIIDHIILYSFP